MLRLELWNGSVVNCPSVNDIHWAIDRSKSHEWFAVLIRSDEQNEFIQACLEPDNSFTIEYAEFQRWFRIQRVSTSVLSQSFVDYYNDEAQWRLLPWTEFDPFTESLSSSQPTNLGLATVMEPSLENYPILQCSRCGHEFRGPHESSDPAKFSCSPDGQLNSDSSAEDVKLGSATFLGTTNISHPLLNTEVGVTNLVNFFERSVSLRSLAKRGIELRFRVARSLTVLVAGPFNSGKSTLLNCLVGQDVFQSSVIPSTAVPTSLCYGESLCAYGKDADGTLHELSLEQLSDHSQEAATFTELLLKVPVPFLTNVVLVDSPGLHSLIESHSRETIAAHDHVDAVLWVTSCAQSATAAEMDDIASLQGRLRPLVVANQVDLLGDEEEREVSLERMRTRLNLDSRTLLGLSASTALQGLVAHDKQQVRMSGWTLFIDTLTTSFLPTRHAQRFALISEELLELLKDAELKLDEELSELHKRESDNDQKQSALVAAMAYEKAIGAGLLEWQACPSTYLKVSKPSEATAAWLSKSLDQCCRLLEALKLPSGCAAMPMDVASRWHSKVVELNSQSQNLRSKLESKIEATTSVEERHSRYLSAQRELNDKRVEFNVRSPFMQSVCFRYRKKLEEDEVAMRNSRQQDERAVSSTTAEVESLIADVNKLTERVADFVKTGAETMESELVRASAAMNHCRELAAESQRLAYDQAWARDARIVFFNELRPEVLAAIATDLANARQLLA